MAFFRSNVYGLSKLPARPDGTGSYNGRIDLTGMSALGSRSCPGWNDAIVVCPGPGTGIATFRLPLSSIPYYTGGYLFAVRVDINGPSMTGASCHTPAGPADYVCQGSGHALYDGTVDGTYVCASRSTDPGYPDPGYFAMPSEYHADNSIEPTSFAANTSWPDDSMNNMADSGLRPGYLVNPAPVWPNPDLRGNTFGQCLFEHAQLPAAIETTITYFNYEQVIDGQLHVAVTVYNLNEPLPEDAYYGDVAGYV